MPITWQNIQAPSNREVFREFAGASDGILGGFDRLSKVFSDREAVNQGVADRGRQAAQEGYLNLLQGYKTPEELQAARMSGVLDQRLAELDPRNQAAVRGSAEARISSLQGQTTANDAFVRGQVQAPVLLANAEAEAQNAPITRDIARTALLQQQALQPITNRTAITTANNAGAAADLTAQLNPSVASNALLEARLRATTLPTQLKEAQNTAEDQALLAATLEASQKYQETKLAGRMKLAPVALKLGLPLDSTGAPDYQNMSKAERIKFGSEAIMAGVSKSATSIDDLYSGDTKAANTHLNDLRKDPRFTDGTISRNQAKILGAFNSVTIGAPVGDDALAISRRLAQAQVRVTEQDSRNRYAPGSPDALTAYEQLAQTIKSELPENVKEDLPELQKMLARLSTKGLEVRKGVFITPSAQDILGAVRGYDKWNFRNARQAEDIESQLKEQLKGSDVTELLRQQEESKAFKRSQAVSALLNRDTPVMPTLNPLQLPPQAPVKK
jgi:hypothetical protein